MFWRLISCHPLFDDRNLVRGRKLLREFGENTLHTGAHTHAHPGFAAENPCPEKKPGKSRRCPLWLSADLSGRCFSGFSADISLGWLGRAGASRRLLGYLELRLPAVSAWRLRWRRLAPLPAGFLLAALLLGFARFQASRPVFNPAIWRSIMGRVRCVFRASSSNLPAASILGPASPAFG